MTKRLRVIQWTTGNVGRRALRAILARPDFELVGVYAHARDKLGRDAAELCGLATPSGVRATDDVEALLALKPDACSYNPLWPSTDELCRLLEAGVNVCSTAALITGSELPAADRARLEAAAQRGRATLFGSGVNPGFANLFALVSSQICERVEQVRVLESADASAYASKQTQEDVGFAQAIKPELAQRTQRASRVFAEAVALMGDALGAELDEIAFDADYAPATADCELGFMTIPRGTVAAIDGRWRGRVRGRDLIVLRFQWIMGKQVEPPFKLRHGYFVEIDGLPSVRSQFQIFPPRGWREPSFMGLGMIMTAMPAVNAIPAVVAAAPGIATHATLSLVAARAAI
jgi:hypothetical protein